MRVGFIDSFRQTDANKGADKVCIHLMISDRIIAIVSLTSTKVFFFVRRRTDGITRFAPWPD